MAYTVRCTVNSYNSRCENESSCGSTKTQLRSKRWQNGLRKETEPRNRALCAIALGNAESEETLPYLLSAYDAETNVTLKRHYLSQIVRVAGKSSPVILSRIEDERNEQIEIDIKE